MSGRTPLVSIIIPVYNAQDYLDKCLQSVTSQEYENLEIVLVDDGSKDESVRICTEWMAKDPRVKL